MVSSLLSGVSTSESAFKVRMLEGAAFLAGAGGSGFAAGADVLAFRLLGEAEPSGAVFSVLPSAPV